jgi:Amt family ammonium transporter
MESGKNGRQKLLVFMVALLGVALLWLALGNPALADDSPPACGGKILENCTPNSGDTAWMLTSVALVLMMTIPGLGLFYGGMVRKKNVGDTVMTSFAVTCLVTILFAILTYSMAFRSGTPFVGGLDRMFLKDILSDIGAGGIGNPNPLAPTIPEAVYICFQMTFAIITPALIAGAFAERMKFSAMLWFIGLWAIFVYAPIAHWVWGPDGIFSSGNDDAWVKVLDFAGGTVVHINAGVAGLMCAIMLGKRAERGPAHNMVLTFIGASLLWVGWFGFNAGSAVSAGMQAGMAMLVTQVATAVAAFTWMLVEWALKGKPTVVGICSGAVAGLRLCGTSRRVCDRHCRRRLLLLGMHRLQAHVLLRRRAGLLWGTCNRRYCRGIAHRRVRGQAVWGNRGRAGRQPRPVRQPVHRRCDSFYL